MEQPQYNYIEKDLKKNMLPFLRNVRYNNLVTTCIECYLGVYEKNAYYIDLKLKVMNGYKKSYYKIVLCQN